MDVLIIFIDLCAISGVYTAIGVLIVSRKHAHSPNTCKVYSRRRVSSALVLTLATSWPPDPLAVLPTFWRYYGDPELPTRFCGMHVALARGWAWVHVTAHKATT